MNGAQVDGTEINVVTSGLACETVGGAATSTLKTDVDASIANCGLAVGNVCTISWTGVGGSPVTSKIVSITNSVTPNRLEIEFEGAAIFPATGTDPKIVLAADTRALRIRPQFRLVQVAPNDMVIKEMSKGLNYSFTTYDYFVDTITQSVRKHLIELNSVATKAVAVMTTFSNGNQLEEQLFSSYFAGEDANDLKMNSVQYFLKGRLAPVRAYDPRNNNEKIISQNELNKALQTLNVEPKDLGNTDGKNIENYTNCFTIARQLARRGYYYDLSNAEGQIRLGFTGARTENQITNTFIWSQKVITVDPSGDLNVIL